MTDSTHLALPFLDQGQAQKHVTHNEALRILDGVVQASVLDRDLAAPPATPANGDRYLVAVGASGAFAGQAGKLAIFEDAAWRFLAPSAGWRLHVADENIVLIHTGAAWQPLGTALGAVENIASLGLGTTSDASNKLIAKLRNALFLALTPAEGGDGDVQVKLAKTALADVASLLFQNNFSGRAEAGLIGDDRLRVKVSANGSVWFDGMEFDPASGKATFQNGAEAPAGLARADVQIFATSASWTKPTWAKWVLVTAVGGGGGGGSGRRGAAASAAGGGSGGAAGHFVERVMPASLLAATVPVTIGAGGLGGAAVADNLNGLDGAQGGTTGFDVFIQARGGRGGAKGATASGITSTTFIGYSYPTNTEAYGGAGGATAAGSAGGYSGRGAGGGGGGGFMNTTNVEATGGPGGVGDLTTTNYAAAGAAGSIATPNGGNGGNGVAAGSIAGSGGGGGGGGGASKAAAASGNGGNGGNYGGGGGGGGGARNTFTGGAGGNGGPGVLIAISIG